jgi:hypothetical protein
MKGRHFRVSERLQIKTGLQYLFARKKSHLNVISTAGRNVIFSLRSRDDMGEGNEKLRDICSGDRIDLARHHHLEAVSHVRRVGHEDFAGHQAVLCRPDHVHGWFSGALDDKGVERGSQ